jgi:hypothetical protein
MFDRSAENRTTSEVLLKMRWIQEGRETVALRRNRRGYGRWQAPYGKLRRISPRSDSNSPGLTNASSNRSSLTYPPVWGTLGLTLNKDGESKLQLANLALPNANGTYLGLGGIPHSGQKRKVDRVLSRLGRPSYHNVGGIVVCSSQTRYGLDQSEGED